MAAENEWVIMYVVNQLEWYCEQCLVSIFLYGGEAFYILFQKEWITCQESFGYLIRH